MAVIADGGHKFCLIIYWRLTKPCKSFSFLLCVWHKLKYWLSEIHIAINMCMNLPDICRNFRLKTRWRYLLYCQDIHLMAVWTSYSCPVLCLDTYTALLVELGKAWHRFYWMRNHQAVVLFLHELSLWRTTKSTASSFIDIDLNHRLQ